MNTYLAGYKTVALNRGVILFPRRHLVVSIVVVGGGGGGGTTGI